ncbi:MAG: WecB/TagA/CpsF family glycosyltransferase [Candidatus Lutibacillus vidarii]
MIGGLGVDAVTSSDVSSAVVRGWECRRAGMIVTPNVDIWLRTRREPATKDLVDAAALVVADGMPLLWAGRLAGTPLPERVAGSELVETLAALAAAHGRSLFIVGGGEADSADAAAAALSARYPGLRIVGTVVPPFGFESVPGYLDELYDRIVASGADLVYVGLGFPKQERFAAPLVPRMPATWFLGCGGGIGMAAGSAARSPRWVQQLGLEWTHRLIQEPRRLAKRYLVDDIPAAVRLLSMSARTRARRRVQ